MSEVREMTVKEMLGLLEWHGWCAKSFKFGGLPIFPSKT